LFNNFPPGILNEIIEQLPSAGLRARLGGGVKADDVEIDKSRRTWYWSQENSLTSFQSVISSYKQHQVFRFEVWQKRTKDQAWWRSQLLKAQVVSAFVESVPVINLKTAKIDITAGLQDFESSPHRCACDILIERLPYVVELQMRANPICTHFLQRALERHPASWPLEKLYINISFLEDPETVGELQLMIRRAIYICKAYIPAGQRIPRGLPRLKLARAINRAGKAPRNFLAIECHLKATRKEGLKCVAIDLEAMEKEQTEGQGNVAAVASTETEEQKARREDQRLKLHEVSSQEKSSCSASCRSWQKRSWRSWRSERRC